MRFDELQARVIALCKLEGWVDVSPAPAWNDLVNDALLRFSWETEYKYDTDTVTLAVSQAVYDLPSGPDWKRITDANLSGNALVLTDENLLRRENPSWIVAATSTPNRYFMPEPNKIQFYPTPSAVGTVTVRGPRADGPLALQSDSPACPAHYHEAIALLAAWKHGKQYASSEAMGRVTAYLSEANDMMAQMRLYLAEQEAPAFQRRVKRSVAERMTLGWMRWIP